MLKMWRRRRRRRKKKAGQLEINECKFQCLVLHATDLRSKRGKANRQ
jgi:hypothetical protein